LSKNESRVSNALRVSESTKCIEKRCFIMGLLRWIGAIVVCFWVLGLIFSFGGSMVHILLVVAAIMFVLDMILGKN